MANSYRDDPNYHSLRISRVQWSASIGVFSDQVCSLALPSDTLSGGVKGGAGTGWAGVFGS
jgi:hypothetical protein